MKAKLVKRIDLTDVITSFSFETEKLFKYTAGQFVNLTLTGHTEDGHSAERWFTLSSSPHESLVTVTTRVGAAAHTHYKRTLDAMELGTFVDISEPMGDFVLPKLMQTPLIFVAGGIGITPFRSMLEWIASSGEERFIKFLLSVRSEEDIIFQDSLERAHQHATIVVEQPSSAWGGERGDLTAEMVLGLEQPVPDALIYLSGPEPFVQAMQTDLQVHGVNNQMIVTDEFQGYAEV